jgi:hypothetical protein
MNCPVQAFSHKITGKSLHIHPPYNIEKIMQNPGIEAADILDDNIHNLKEFRDYWFRNGVID